MNCYLNEFRRKKFHRVTTIIGFELLPQSYLWVIAEAVPTDFREENFLGRPKIHKIHEIFK